MTVLDAAVPRQKGRSESKRNGFGLGFSFT